MHEKRHFLYYIEIHLTRRKDVSPRCCIRMKSNTMYNYNPSMSEFFLVDSLGIDEGLIEESPHCRGLIESNNTIVCAHLLECTQHRSLVPIW